MSLFCLYKHNRLFFFGFMLFAVLAIFLLVFYSKHDGFFLLNTYHSDILTWFFIYATYLGDGLFCIIVGVLLFLFKKRFLGLMVIVSYAFSGIMAQIIKQFVIEPRPGILFKDSGYRYFIEDVTLHNLHAFPSGHTASAFALAAVLSFGIRNKSYSLLFLFGAILVGYSRIYLAQHFTDDVLAGAVIGVMSSIICYVFLSQLFQRAEVKRAGKNGV